MFLSLVQMLREGRGNSIPMCHELVCPGKITTVCASAGAGAGDGAGGGVEASTVASCWCDGVG